MKLIEEENECGNADLLAENRIDTRAEDGPDLATVVDSLCQANYGLTRQGLNGDERHILPSRDVMVSIVEDLRSVLFPGYFGNPELTRENIRFQVGNTLDSVLRRLRVQVDREQLKGKQTPI